MKIFEIELVNCTVGNFEDGERQKFLKLFEEWLNSKEMVTRIILLSALISEVESIIPEALKDVFPIGMTLMVY